MKKNLATFLQIITVLIGLTVLVFMIWEPQAEGVNVGHTIFQTYFQDPFLAYAYLSSILFFTSLWQAFKGFGLVRENKTFSSETVRALQTIRYCMSTLALLILAGLVYLIITVHGTDDMTGGIFMALLLIFISGMTSVVAKVFEGIVQKGNQIESENNLIV